MLRYLLWHALSNALGLAYLMVAAPAHLLGWLRQRLAALRMACERRIRRGF